MDGHREPSAARPRTLPPTNVRLLTSEEELAAAVARAEEGAKRLHDRLAARAAHDAWMAEHSEQRVGWRQFLRGAIDRPAVVAAASPSQRAGAPDPRSRPASTHARSSPAA